MLTNTREQPSGPPVCLDTHEVARPRPGLLVGNVPVSPTSPAGVTTARVWVLAWVSTPMTKSKLSATIAMRHRPPSSRFGVVTASAREEAVVGRNCKGSPPGGYRAGHASDQATATRPGPAPAPTTSTCGHIPTKDTSCPRVSQFSGHAHPRSRDQHRSCQPAPGQPPPHLQSVFSRRQQWRSAAADGRAPRCGRYQAEPFGIAVTAPALHLPEGAACGRAESDGHVPGPRVVNPGSAPATAIPV